MRGQRRADAGGGHAQRDEHDREREAEDDGREQDLREAALAGLHLGHRNPADRRQVAGHERQHAGRDEGHEPDRERGQDGGVGLGGRHCQSRRASSRSTRCWSSLDSSGAAAAGAVVRAPAPARHEHEQGAQRGEHDDRGHDVDSPVHTVTGRGQRKHVGAVLGHQVLLDLVLGLALGDLGADEVALAVGLGRLGHVERRAADRAHDLVLDVAQRRAGRGRGRRRGGGQREHGDEGEELLHEDSSGPTLRRQKRRVDLAAADRGDLALAVDDEGLGQGAGAVVLGEVAVDVAQARIGQPVLAGKGVGVAGGVAEVDAQDGAATGGDLALELLQQRRLGAARLAP